MPRKRHFPKLQRLELTVFQILVWADTHRERTGRWPIVRSGLIPEALGDNWKRIDNALRAGLRGLPGGSSLAQVLDKHRGVRNVGDLCDLTEEQILAWVDAHRFRTGDWPTLESGPIADTRGEVWRNVDMALRLGKRGLRGGLSLARLIAQGRGVRNRASAPRLTIPQIVAWADSHQRLTGQWPRRDSGPIADAPGETWAAIEAALSLGNRGLGGGSSLAQLLAEHRGVRNQGHLPRLTKQQVLAWADAHFARTGQWPNAASGPVAEAFGETWKRVQNALVLGLRGFRGGSSLHRLLKAHRRIRGRAASVRSSC
jgi:pyrroloquinoline quinone (PQQ) biosynthesis protein C